MPKRHQCPNCGCNFAECVLSEKQESSDAPSATQRSEVGSADMGRAVWEYSHYRATLRKNGKFFALVTPDGRNALSEGAERELLFALNNSPTD